MLLHSLCSDETPRYGDSPYVCPAILDRAGVPRVGTHGIRHRSITDIANSGIPVKVGMALTAHQTIAMFMRYVHTEDDLVSKAAELVASRRKSIVGMCQDPKKVAT